jgi:2-oxoglutarate dehydrogenase E1 component
MFDGISSENLPFLEFEKPQVKASLIGFEYEGFCTREVQEWIDARIREAGGVFTIAKEKKLNLLRLLGKAADFETFLHTRYVGQKRFSLEGAETLIPLLWELILLASNKGYKEIILGMPHRGRLNVLANIFNKSSDAIFAEFEDMQIDIEGSGDVKYHKGYTSVRKVSPGKDMHLWMAANPSHLESVCPVVEGIARAKRDAFPLIVHGDAAISGQGAIYETLQLANLRGYSTGGTIHIVINNHIGFTTVPKDSRSTKECTDIAKAFGAPVLHINAEEPESCLWAALCAFDFREAFAHDIFLDLNCYRKYGHNETDEPSFTQPLLYREIKAKRPIHLLYEDKLILEGVVRKDFVESLEKEFKTELQEAFQALRHKGVIKPSVQPEEEEAKEGAFISNPTEGLLKEFAIKLSTVPDGFMLHPRIAQKIDERRKKIADDFSSLLIDWAFAEALILAELLYHGKKVRFSGQDSRRGTFSQRHGVWIDQNDEREYYPHGVFEHYPGQFELIDSPLSEFAALGFEYGFSLGDPEAAVFWEAQFGDFVNEAQVIIDQYIASGWQKWGAKSRLCLLLPHGYEGQGPEHSSARMERFLSLCAGGNMYVAVPSNPSQFFHLLRRHFLLAKEAKPLVVFTPKGLLRHPACQSRVKALSDGSFQEVLFDAPEFSSATKILLCQGRIFYDLDLERKKRKTTHIACIRIEQLYPLLLSHLKKAIDAYPQAVEFLWVQEEPVNMGAWGFMRELIEPLLPRNKKLHYRGRPASSSPAVGSHAMHEQEHTAIMESVFGS